MLINIKLVSLNMSLSTSHHLCPNPSLGLMTKVRACKGVGQEGSLGITSHAPGNVGKCEEVNLHTPKWTFTLGIGIPMDSRIFKEQLQGSKPIRLRSYSYDC
jgi:hypothetical protein